MSKEKDLEFIKKYSKISITAICKKIGANRGNVWSGRASTETIHKVREAITSELDLINGE
jgi:hypothetical protein